MIAQACGDPAADRQLEGSGGGGLDTEQVQEQEAEQVSEEAWEGFVWMSVLGATPR